MFQPTDYQSKRAALNEIMLQNLLRAVMRLTAGNDTVRNSVITEWTQYERGMRGLRDLEANRVLGAVTKAEGVQYIDHSDAMEYMKENLGRTYFNSAEPTPAPDGSIGTAGFGTKFKDWVHGLPDFDESLTKEMASGFYKDTGSRPGQELPILVLRVGDEITVLVYNNGLDIQTLSLPHVAEDYRWDAASHWPLRGEMFTYRGNYTRAEFEHAFLDALAKHDIGTLEIPTSVLEKAAPVGRGMHTPIIQIDEAPFAVVKTDSEEASSVGRGLTSPTDIHG